MKQKYLTKNKILCHSILLKIKYHKIFCHLQKIVGVFFVSNIFNFKDCIQTLHLLL